MFSGMKICINLSERVLNNHVGAIVIAPAVVVYKVGIMISTRSGSGFKSHLRASHLVDECNFCRVMCQ